MISLESTNPVKKSPCQHYTCIPHFPTVDVMWTFEQIKLMRHSNCLSSEIAADLNCNVSALASGM